MLGDNSQYYNIAISLLLSTPAKFRLSLATPHNSRDLDLITAYVNGILN